MCLHSKGHYSQNIAKILQEKDKGQGKKGPIPTTLDNFRYLGWERGDYFSGTAVP